MAHLTKHLIVISLFFVSLQLNADHQKIFILNSYHPGYCWSDDIISGLKEVLEERAVLTVEYMDTKHYTPGTLFPLLKELYAAKYAHEDYKLIITTDNNALNFLNLYREELFGTVPVVFCGVNDYAPSLRENLPDATGVEEFYDFSLLLDLILELFPGTRFLIAVSDNTETGQIELAGLRQSLETYPGGFVYREFIALTPGEINRGMKDVDPGKTIIVYLSCNRDHQGNIYTQDEGIRLFSDNYSCPLFVKVENMVGAGALGGVVNSGFYQGRRAGELALDVLEGKDPALIPVIRRDVQEVLLDASLLKKYGLSRDDLPYNAQLINDRFPLFKNKLFYIIAGGGLLILLVVTVYTMIRSFILSRALSLSRKKHMELIEEINDGVFFTDLNGFITYANKSFCRILGARSEEEVAGKNFLRYLTPEFKKKALSVFKEGQAPGKSAASMELMIKRPDGAVRWIAVKPLISYDRINLAGARGVVTDITDAKFNETKLLFQKNISFLVNKVPSIEELFWRMTDEIIKLDEIDAGCVYLMDQEQSLNLIYSRRMISIFTYDAARFSKNSVFTSLVCGGHPLYLPYGIFKDQMEVSLPGDDLFRFIILLPLQSAGQILGALMLFSFSNEDISLYTKQLLESVVPFITDAFIRVRGEEEKNKIFSLSQDVISIVDFTGRFQFINEAFEKSLGYSRKKVLENSFFSFVLPEDQEKTRQALSLLKEGHELRDFENRYMDSQGNIHWFSWRSTPEVNRGLVYAIARDVTMKKEGEELLKRAKDEAEQANKTKSEFLANMSHEIRTPLNAIIGFSELLTALLEGEKEIHYLRSIKTAGKSLLTLINDILDLSKMEAGKMEIQFGPVHLKELLGEIEQIFKVRILDKGLGFSIDIKPGLPDWLVLDEIRLRQVLLNIVGNGVKFTEAGAIRIVVDYESHISEKKIELFIQVEDTGIGIPEDQFPLIFQSFKQQSGQMGKKYGGTGLGLAISKKLMEMMGGEIEVSSRVGEGTVFRLVLKGVHLSAQGAIIPRNEKLINDVRFRKTRVLVVDDTESNRAFMKEVLLKADLEPVLAESGVMALELLEEEKPGLIIMDLRMPGMDGIETTRRIRAKSEFSKVPVIALTASVKKHLAPEEELFDSYILKPLDINILYRELGRFITILEQSSGEEEPSREVSLDMVEISDSLMKIINNKILGDMEQFKGVIRMDRLKKTGALLRDVGGQYGILPLAAVGEDMIDASAQFDVIKARNAVDQFYKIYEMLVKKVEV